MKCKILGHDSLIYSKPDLKSIPLEENMQNCEFKMIKTFRNDNQTWVEIILPNDAHAFIPGNTRIYEANKYPVLIPITKKEAKFPNSCVLCNKSKTAEFEASCSLRGSSEMQKSLKFNIPYCEKHSEHVKIRKRVIWVHWIFRWLIGIIVFIGAVIWTNNYIEKGGSFFGIKEGPLALFFAIILISGIVYYVIRFIMFCVYKILPKFSKVLIGLQVGPHLGISISSFPKKNQLLFLFSNEEAASLFQEMNTPKIYCPYCREKMPPIVENCLKCKANLKSLQQESEYKCQHCGSDVPEDAKYCPKCGANLEA